MRRAVFDVRFLFLVLVAMLAGVWPMAAQAAGLGTAAGFAVLASKAVTCTGPNSNVTGPVGVSSSTTAITKTGCTMNVQVNAGAYAAFRTAYTAGLGACGQTLASTLPGVTNLASGTYCTPAALTLTGGTLNLTGSGPWNFEIGTGGTGALTTTDLKVVSGNPCNVFWWVSQGVTLTRTPFQGTILGGTDITLTDTPLSGRVWATGAVTLTRSPVLGCTAGGTLPGQRCKKGADNDVDEDDDRSSGDRHESVTSARHATHGDEERGKHREHGDSDRDRHAKDCDADESNEGNDD